MSATINNNLPTLSNEGGLSVYLEQMYLLGWKIVTQYPMGIHRSALSSLPKKINPRLSQVKSRKRGHIHFLSHSTKSN